MKNLKKILATIFALVVVGITGNTLIIASAYSFESEADKLLFATINEIFDYEQKNNGVVVMEKVTLFDIDLNELGLLYNFEFQEQKGFAILIDDGELQITELYTEEDAPYKNDKYKYVYVMQGVYWYSDGEQFYECLTGLPVSESSYNELKENAYSGEINTRFESERVEYEYRTENKYNILTSIPNCQYAKLAGCVPLAATNLIVYYDKDYSNLIPNYEPGKTFLGRYIFNTENDTTKKVCDDLYDDMGTNSFLSGTSVAQFKNGLKKYINRQGYTVEYSSLMSQGSFNFGIAKSTVQSEIAMVLFIKQYQSLQINKYDGYDILEYEITDSNHAVAGFGCLEVSYTLSGNEVRKDEYVYASLGLGIYGKGYINTNRANIDDALAVRIMGD